MDFNGIRRLYLPLRPKARFSPGRKTPPSVSAPSAGLRPLSVSRVKCGGGPCRGHSVLPCTGNTICLHCAFMKGARFDICLRKHVVADTQLMRTPKSANGPRSNSFRPDSPSTTNLPRGWKTQSSPSPHRTWSVPDASSKPQLNLHFFQDTLVFLQIQCYNMFNI